MSKSILSSKTLWLNVIGIASMVIPGLPIDPEIGAVVLAVLNIINRKFTTQPIHVTTPGS